MATIPVPVNKMSVLAVGEILWDVIGPDRHLGGAPFNFAYYCRAQGAIARVLSRVGADEAGELALARARELGVSTALIQIDSLHPTGEVEALVGEKGDASYTFPPNRAWDHITFPDNARNAADYADILYYGTLAQRSPISRAATLAVLASVPASCLRVLDLNLRDPLPRTEILKTSLALADVLKLNVQELGELRTIFSLPEGDISATRELMARYEIPTVVVTDGAEGAMAVVADGTVIKAPGHPVTVADTIGSGDAFAAAFVVHLASGSSVEDALHIANAAGAWVATQPGATPPVDLHAIRHLAVSSPVAA